MSNKTIWTIIGLSLVLFFIFYGASVNNTAVGYEESVNSSTSDINVMEKRKVDLIGNLVQVVEEYFRYENTTLKEVTEMRTSFNSGNIQQTQLAINAVMEAYPELKGNEVAVNLMNELSITENMLAETRKYRNTTVEKYRRFVRRFPNRLFLVFSGYEVQNFEYLNYDNPELPAQLFNR